MAIPNTLGFNQGAFSSKGEDYFWFRFVNSDSTAIEGETWQDGVLVGGLKFPHSQPETDINGCSGRVLNSEPDNVSTSFELTLKHNDSNIFNALNTDFIDKFVAFAIPHGQGSNSTNKWFYAPLCKVQRGHGDYTLQGGDVTMTVKVLDNPSAFTGGSLSAGSITSSTLWNASMSASISGAAHISFISRNI